MTSLTIAAASNNLSCSPAMLITRQKVGDWVARWPLPDCQWRVHREAFQPNSQTENQLWGGLEGGQASPRKHAAAQATSADSELLEVNEA